MKDIGIIGFGTLGGAIASACNRASPGLRIYATRAHDKLLASSVERCESNAELARSTSFVLLCVKPQQLAPVLEELAPVIGPHHIVVSACAGVPLEALCETLRGTTKIARIMPNIACEINEGVTALCYSPAWEGEGKEDVIALLDLLGRTVVLEERHFDAVTAVSGCGPAYVCVIIEALTDAAVKQGLPRDAARLPRSGAVLQPYGVSRRWLVVKRRSARSGRSQPSCHPGGIER